MYGQYDKFVSVEFNRSREEYKKFGLRLMGTFIFTLQEREELQEVLNSDNIPRTNRKIKFKPSELERLSNEQKVDLDRDGILCSSIDSVYARDLPKINRFAERGKKEFQNVMHIKAPEFNGWDELNYVQLGFLNSRYSKGQALAPKEFYRYWALRKHFNVGTNQEDYIENVINCNQEVKTEIRLEELRIRYDGLSITKDELKELIELDLEKIRSEDKIIEKEIQRSTERINTVSENYGLELEKLKEICRSFNEKIIAFGNKLIYLDFERFVHIYARHVAETQIGERFADNKTVFQYKFDDIITLIKMVIKSVNKEIQEHFRNNPARAFRRQGSRSVYFDGHYYRIEIEPNGRLKDFRPCNDDENTGANNVQEIIAV